MIVLSYSSIVRDNPSGMGFASNLMRTYMRERSFWP